MKSLLPSIILAFALLAAAFFIASSVEHTAQQLELVTTHLDTLAKLSGAPSAGQAAPEKYEVDVGSAPIRGNADATVTIVEWSDFQCPFCKRVAPTLSQIQAEYGDKVRFAFKHLPLSIHSQAAFAHAAAEAANRQGEFWAMHDILFINQKDLSVEAITGYAKEIGLNMQQFQKDLASPDINVRINEDTAQARDLGVNGTPAFFVNGKLLSGAQPFAAFKVAIDAALTEAEE